MPGPQVAPALVDLDHIIARLQLVWGSDVIGDWLEGPNAFLEGARPIDVLLTHGSAMVLEAIEAEASGAYA
ncbi:MAG: MbcA/ParS/Xre antitoxin family protein [Actinomycetota bacterium]|nr:MbcA/ParS/Xre antitoxin family protein [Actinomycetota bacterium]